MEVLIIAKLMKMEEKLFRRFIKNQCSKEELRAVSSWIIEKDKSLEDDILFRKFWNDLNLNHEIPELSEDGLLDKIHHLLNIRMNSCIRPADRSAEKPLMRFGRILTKIAAFLFIPLFFVSLFLFFKRPQETITEAQNKHQQIYQQITSPMGNKTRLELSDGSIVWLNHGSSLRFPLQFTGNSRLVHLEGEAYFEVSPHVSNPFLVQINDIQVVATGTEFNIMAYKDENAIEATLKSGSITLRKLYPEQRVMNLLTLEPCQQAKYYQQEKRIAFADVDPANYTSWKDGKLVMMDDQLSRIAKKLERWYNVHIEFSSEELGYIRYSGTFTNETLDQVLALMKLATPIDYTLYQREKLPDGTFSLPRVKIFLKKGYKISLNPGNL